MLLEEEDRIGEQDASSPRLTSLPLEKTVPAEDEEDSRMALAFPDLILYKRPLLHIKPFVQSRQLQPLPNALIPTCGFSPSRKES